MEPPVEDRHGRMGDNGALLDTPIKEELLPSVDYRVCPRGVADASCHRHL